MKFIKRILLGMLVMTAFLTFSSFQGQTKEKKATDKDGVYLRPEKAPQFKGGDEALFKFLNDNLKYPEKAKLNKIQGKVFVQFVIDENGKVTNAKVVRGIGYGCDNEALKAVKKMPNWIPGKMEANRSKFK